MPDGASELSQLAIDLGKVGRVASEHIGAAVSKAALGIKDDWNDLLAADAPSRFSHAKGTPIGDSVTYDLSTKGHLGMALSTAQLSFEAEIGPVVGRKRTMGPHAGWLESGSVDGVPQTKPGDNAAKANEQNFYDYLQTAASDALRDAL